MPKFAFPLEAVLSHRTLAERERLRDLALAQGEMTRLQQELKTLNDSLRGIAADMKENHLIGTLDVNYLAAHRRYTVATQRRGNQLVQDMARQQRKVDEAQRLLAEAAKERKVIEKLRERQLERWKAEVMRKEQADADEVGAQFGYRRMVEASSSIESVSSIESLSHRVIESLEKPTDRGLSMIQCPDASMTQFRNDSMTQSDLGGDA